MKFKTYSRLLEPDIGQSDLISGEIAYHPEPQTEIEVLDDVYFFPNERCLFDSQGVRIDSSLQQGDRRRRNFWPPNASVNREIPAEIPFLDCSVVYLGVLFPHYGHFLLECISRLWAIASLKDEGPLKFLYSESSGGSFWRDGYVTEFMHLASIPLDNFIFFDNPVKIRRAYIPNQSFFMVREAYSNHADLIHKAAERVLSGGLPPLRDQPLYISRSQFRHNPWELRNDRFVANEFELEEILKNNGFHICHAEMLSLQQKILLYNSHRFIFGPRGSGLLTWIFSLRPQDQETCILYEDGKFNFILDYSLNNILAGADTYYVGTLAPQLGDINEPTGRPGNSLEVDVERTVEWLRRRGVLEAHGVSGQKKADLDSPEQILGRVTIHLQGYGDNINHGQLAAGRRGSGRFIEGLSIVSQRIPEDQIEYQIVTDQGEISDWVCGGVFCGTRYQGRPLRGFGLRLSGEAAQKFTVSYICAFIGEEELHEGQNGQLMRSSSDAPLEAIRIKIEAL